MRSDSSQRDSLGAVILRSRADAEDIFRRQGVAPNAAEKLLLEGVQWLESPHGILRGAGQILIKWLEAACRRAASERDEPFTAGCDYGPAFERTLSRIEHIRGRCTRDAARYAEWREAGGSPSENVPEPSKHWIIGLLENARKLWKTDPVASLAHSRRALELLAEVPRDPLEQRFLADLEARGHAYAGNALRLLYEYRHAELELDTAEDALARGTHDPRERAQLLMYLATLQRDQRHFDVALDHLQQAAAIYGWSRDHHNEGLVRLLMATTQAYANRAELAVPLAERARELIDGNRDPRMKAALEMNMAHYLQAAGRAEEARAQLPTARRLMEASGTRNDLRNLRWIEGRVALALSEHDEGERLLTEVREEYVVLGDSYDAALVSLELVAHYLDLGRAADARRLAAESLPIFQSLEIHRETLAALIALQRATELETATAGLVRELLERLRRGNAAAPPRPEKPS